MPAQQLQPDVILVNIGANDLTLFTPQATYETNVGLTLDALHAKWSKAQFYLMRPWRRDRDTESATMATWITNILSTRSAWAAVGPDEAVFLKAADNGVTYTTEGVHPNVAGYALTAAEWQLAMGY